MTEEQPKEKVKKEIVVVLELEGHTITVDAANWTLDGKAYYTSLSGALKGMSDLILRDNLKGRSNEDIQSLASLVKLLNVHDEWFKALTKGV